MENEKKGNFKTDSVFSKKIRAGKRRTYFFDVRSTRSNDYFLTITESKKRQDDTYERFKIFLYKEDFNKFVETLQETVDHIKTQLMPNFDFDAFDHKEEYNDHHYTQNNESASTSIENSANQNERIIEVKSEANLPKEQPAEMPPPPSTSDDDLKW